MDSGAWMRATSLPSCWPRSSSTGDRRDRPMSDRFFLRAVLCAVLVAVPFAAGCDDGDPPADSGVDSGDDTDAGGGFDAGIDAGTDAGHGRVPTFRLEVEGTDMEIALEALRLMGSGHAGGSGGCNA